MIITNITKYGDLLGAGAAGQVMQAIYRPLNASIAVKVHNN